MGQIDSGRLLKERLYSSFKNQANSSKGVRSVYLYISSMINGQADPETFMLAATLMRLDQCFLFLPVMRDI